MTYWGHSSASADKCSWQPLEDHLHAVAETAKNFGAAFGADEAAWLAGICHDLGKYSKEFQERLEDSRIRVDHTTAGATVAASEYGLIGRLIAYAIAGHHGGIPNGSNDPDRTSLEDRLRRKDLCDFSAYTGEIELPSQAPRLPVSPSDGQDSLGFTACFFTRMLYSCLVDADFLDTEQFLEPVKARLRGGAEALPVLEQSLMEHLEKMRVSAPPTFVNRKRAEVLEDCLVAAEQTPGLFSLTVPTGGGKTLSSLAFALKHARLHGLGRVIYVIPFTSIIDQNAKVFRDAVGADAVLEHHSNVVRPIEDPDEGSASRIELAEENWDMPLVVTTNVQFFESLFSNKPSRCRKLHSIAKSVVILDEAQMLPLELLKPCVAAMAELVTNYGATLVLCSATQPALGSLFPPAVQPREIVRDASGLYRALKRVEVTNKGLAGDEEIAADLLAQKQVLCVVNTRAHARYLFESLGEDEGHYHLSAAMCPVHRAKRLDDIRTRLTGGETCRVVSTQLIEAGVDVDFPVVVRAIAGIDSIAQAAGRCNREGKAKKGKVVVFTPEGKQGMSHVWFRRTASIAAAILERQADPLDLVSVEQYFRDLYFYEGQRDGSPGQPSQLDAKGIMQRIKVEAGQLNFPFRDVSEMFKVIGDDTVGLVVPYDCECKRLLAEVRAAGISRRRARRLQPYSVSVRFWEYRQLLENGAVEEIDGLAALRDMRLYDQDYGLALRSETAKGSDAWIV